MVQRHICSSLGPIRRSVTVDRSIISRCPSRAFTGSAQRLEEPSTKAPSAPSAPANPNSRRARSELAMKQIASLPNRRTLQPNGLAKGNAPAGQMAQRRTPRTTNPDAAGASRSPGAQASADGSVTSKPRFAKFTGRPTPTHGAGSPPGQMVRGPRKVNMDPSTPASKMRGPKLGARKGTAKGGSGGSDSSERGPRRRERKPKEQDTEDSVSLKDTDPAKTMSDGMVQHLLRLQRKEWDPVSYEPIYGHGSLAAQQLIHEGRELFKGEAPPVKIWGGLEKRLGVVGMFGAEAHLKVRRVPDGDAAPFGEEDAYEIAESKKVSDTATNPATQ